MATEKQIEANRINAQRSTGPRTAEGKARVRLNALRHGLRVEVFDVLPNEDAAAFAARMEAWNRDLRPANELEAELVRQIVCLTWKIDRAARYEHAIRSTRMNDVAYACGLKGEDPALAEAIAAHDPSTEGDRLHRYQASLRRDLLRTQAAFSRLRKENEARWDRDHEDASAEPIAAAPLTPDPSVDPAPAMPSAQSAAAASIESDPDDLFAGVSEDVTIKANPLYALGQIHRITGGRTPLSMVKDLPKGFNPTPTDRISCERE